MGRDHDEITALFLGFVQNGAAGMPFDHDNLDIRAVTGLFLQSVDDFRPRALDLLFAQILGGIGRKVLHHMDRGDLSTLGKQGPRDVERLGNVALMIKRNGDKNIGVHGRSFLLLASNVSTPSLPSLIYVMNLHLVSLSSVAHPSGMKSPIRHVDKDAYATMETLLRGMRHGVLSYTDPEKGTPSASRIAALYLPGHGVVTLVSDLSLHTPALRTGAPCALLVGEPTAKGDALTAPRATLHARPVAVDKNTLRDAWLTRLPKSALYFDFTDFTAFCLQFEDAFLNGGFGKAYRFNAEDLAGYAS